MAFALTVTFPRGLCRVKVTVNGAPTEPEVKTMPRHKKNPDVGSKQTVFSEKIIIEQEDAKLFAVNEEVSWSTKFLDAQKLN